MLNTSLDPNTQLEFDPADLEELKARLFPAMLWFRDSIEREHTEDFYKNLQNLVIGGLVAIGSAALVSGIIGSLFDE
jgi:hypothetical protein